MDRIRCRDPELSSETNLWSFVIERGEQHYEQTDQTIMVKPTGRDDPSKWELTDYELRAEEPA